jgi:CBS domain-containing protein
MAQNPQAAAMLAYVGALREKTALPDLSTLMDSRTSPATVTPRTTVREAAKLMKERRTTAVCVMEPGVPGAAPGAQKIAGIFTSKDVVLRVIAAGLDAGKCSVVRVMTPHPDTAPPTMTIHDALKKMHSTCLEAVFIADSRALTSYYLDGHYLNLPVVENDGRLVAIVDVLKLTYATLEQVSLVIRTSLASNTHSPLYDQMNAVTASTGVAGEAEGGPMWGRFFDSIGGDDNDSVISGSHVPTDLHPSLRLNAVQQSPFSDVHPNDSASVQDDEHQSVIEGYIRGQHHGGHSVVTGGGSAAPADDGTYVFKFRTPSGRTHRFQSRHDNVEHLRDIVSGKLATDPFFTDIVTRDADAPPPDPLDFQLSYTDADGDSVVITSDHDVTEAVKIARSTNTDRVVLFVQGSKAWTEAGADKSDALAAQTTAAAHQETKEVENAEAEVLKPMSPPPLAPTPAPPVYAPPPPPPKGEEVMGIPKDMVLPVSIGALAVVIIAVFTISRLTADRY